MGVVEQGERGEKEEGKSGKRARGEAQPIFSDIKLLQPWTEGSLQQILFVITVW